MTNLNDNLAAGENKRKLDYLNSLQYPIVMERRNNNFYLIITELSLIAVNSDLKAAYGELNEKKEKLFKDALECGAGDTITLPNKLHRKVGVSNHLMIFVYKTLIACLLGALLLVAGISWIKDTASSSIGTVSGSIVSKITKKVEIYANEPDDIKQEKAARLHNILNGLSPYIREFQSAFKDKLEQKK